MIPMSHPDDFLPTVEPSPGFADRVMGRVAVLEGLKATVDAEERRAANLLVIATWLGGMLLGGVVASLLVPPLLALRVTARYALDWLRGGAHGASVPVLFLVLATVVGAWLVCELAPERVVAPLLSRAARRAQV